MRTCSEWWMEAEGCSRFRLTLLIGALMEEDCLLISAACHSLSLNFGFPLLMLFDGWKIQANNFDSNWLIELCPSP